MNPRGTTVKLLQENGFVLARHGANHDIFFEDDMRYILKEAKINRRGNGR